MTGLAKMGAALSPAGTAAFPVVACYTGIFERDHFAALTDLPWWYLHETDPVKRADLIESLHAGADLDWFVLPFGHTAEEQRHVRVVERTDGVFRVDARTGEATPLAPPVMSGTMSVLAEDAPVIDDLPRFLEAAVPRHAAFTGLAPGREALPARLMASLGRRAYPIMHIGSPLWALAPPLGYAQWFEFLATDAETLFAACRRQLFNSVQMVKAAASVGCRAIWIEECLTDQIGPRLFEAYNLPLLRGLTDAIRAAGMRGIYYFCGNPWPVWELIMASGADALALEESKKGFTIDIEEVAARVDGRMTLFGNLDAIDLLEHGTSSELRAEVARQLAAGRRNGNRFVMSTGSPITPGTPVSRVREYVALTREAGGR